MKKSSTAIVLNIVMMIGCFIFTICVDEKNTVMMIGGTIIAICVYIGLYKHIDKIFSYGKKPKSYHLFPRMKKRVVLYLVGLSYWIEQLFTCIYTSNFKVSHNQERANESSQNQTFLENVISQDIKTPIIEEIIFRGLLLLLIIVVFNLIKRNTKKATINIIFVLTSGVVFGLFHCVSWNELFTSMTIATEFESAILYIVPGLIYSVLYVFTQRLYAPILAHMLNNIMGLKPFGEKQSENLIIWFVILLIVGVIYIKLNRKTIKGKRGS